MYRILMYKAQTKPKVLEVRPYPPCTRPYPPSSPWSEVRRLGPKRSEGRRSSLRARGRQGNSAKGTPPLLITHHSDTLITATDPDRKPVAKKSIVDWVLAVITRPLADTCPECRERLSCASHASARCIEPALRFKIAGRPRDNCMRMSE